MWLVQGKCTKLLNFGTSANRASGVTEKAETFGGSGRFPILIAPADRLR
jgi:hypothetical protein